MIAIPPSSPHTYHPTLPSSHGVKLLKTIRKWRVDKDELETFKRIMEDRGERVFETDGNGAEVFLTTETEWE